MKMSLGMLRNCSLSVCVFYWTVLAVLCSLLCIVVRGDVQFTRSVPPKIISVTPNFGSVEGGSHITLYGANFQASGLFTQRVVYVGGQLCKEITYFTTDTNLVCVVPKCEQPVCQSSATWTGSVRVAVDIHIGTVEGILSDTSSFTYSGVWTPSIYEMSKTLRGDTISHVQGALRSTQVTAMEVFLGEGGSRADVGDDDEYNASPLSLWSSNQWLMYKTPSDVTAGLFNLSVLSKDDQSKGSAGTGYARMFPTQKAQLSMSYPYNYLFDCSMSSGSVFSVALLPTIRKVYPSLGSVAGGTRVTITGSGFSSVKAQNVVLVANRECVVESSSYEEIVCVTESSATRAGQQEEDVFQQLWPVVQTFPVTRFTSSVNMTSERRSGSAGWWVSMWSYSNYLSNTMKSSNVVRAFAFKEDLSFSLYYKSGTNWPSLLSFGASNYQYGAEFVSELTMPVSGVYRFYVTSDDVNSLYYARVSRVGSGADVVWRAGAESLLLSTHYSSYDDLFVNRADHESVRVHFHRGEVIRVRSRFANTGGGPDFLRVGFSVVPDRELSTGELLDVVLHNDSSSRLTEYGTVLPALSYVRDAVFLHHHSVRDVQLVQLSMKYQREIQTVTISGIEGGSFALIVQGSVVTSTLTTASSSTDIANALTNAANSLSSSVRECNSFTVTTSLKSNPTAITINVQFNVDNSLPLTLLTAFTADLIGSNVTTATERKQMHSAIPSGTFNLKFPNSFLNMSVDIPYDCSPDSFRSLLQSVAPTTNVGVTRLNSALSGYTWIVTFVTPRGLVPLMHINTSELLGDSVSGSVRKSQNGSEENFFFESIPVWMTQIPLDVATRNETLSGVEVYVNTTVARDDGSVGVEVFKAGCDATPQGGSAVVLDSSASPYVSLFQGDERGCGFVLTTLATPLVSEYRLVDVYSDVWTGVEIVGNMFGDNALWVDVQIAGHGCNVTSINNTHIACLVSSVPWGDHQPEVTVQSLGKALNVAGGRVLSFKQSIYSVSPQRGSLAGGQLVTIRGRGFRPSAMVSFQATPEHVVPCDVVNWASNEIVCRTNMIPHVWLSNASYAPTLAPTASPTSDNFTQTSEPTMAPSETPLLQLPIFGFGDSSVSEWHLEFDRNYVVFVDQLPSNANLELAVAFHYDLDATSVIGNVSHHSTSTAMSYNLSISFRSLPAVIDNVVVEIGNESCSTAVLRDLTVSCYLPRNREFGSLKSVNVKVLFPDFGYAAVIEADMITLPSIQRGFEIFSISPSVGSVMGGNELVLSGFGFAEDMLVNQTIILEQTSWSGFSAYDELLMALGFSSDTTVPEQAFLDCLVTRTSFEEVVCLLPSHASAYDDAEYNVSMVINNVYAVVDAVSASYSQLWSSTPLVFADVMINDVSAAGLYTVTVRGEGLGRGLATVKVAGFDCEVLNGTDAWLTFRTPSLPAGEHLVSVHVNSLGDAHSDAYFFADGGVSSVRFEVSNGSLAGGPLVLIHGHGFSSNCSQNEFQFEVVHGLDQYSVSVSEMLYCTETEVLAEMPSLLSAVASENVRTRGVFEAVTTGLSFGVRSSASDGTASNETYVVQSNVSLSMSSRFTYSLSSTPMVTLNATQGFDDMLELVVHSLFTIDNTSITVFVGGQPCTVLSYLNPQEIAVAVGNDYQPLKYFYAGAVCRVPQLSAKNGSYAVNVWTHPHGYAVVNSSELVASPSYKMQFASVPLGAMKRLSVLGGSELSVTGKGFSNRTQVSVCGVVANATAAAQFDHLAISVPARVTTAAVQYWQSVSVTIEESLTKLTSYGTAISSLSSTTANNVLLANAGDDDYYTYFAHNTQNCYVGLQLKSGMAAQPYRMRFYPRLQYAGLIKGFVFEGKLVGASAYTKIADHHQLVDTSAVHEGWNSVDAGANSTGSWYTAFRYRAVDSASLYSKCQLAEIDFWGRVGYVNGTCDVRVHSPETGKSVFVGVVKYDEQASTPIVRSVSPNNGSALGGTEIALQGELFASEQSLAVQGGETAVERDERLRQSVTVKISGIECSVLSVNATVVRCVTGPRPPESIEVSSIALTVSSLGLATVDDSAEFQYIDRWSAMTSWKNGEMPVDGDLVWVPEGQVILLDVPTPLLAFLLVQGRLIADRDAQQALSIDTNYLLVLGGYFEVGTHEDPFLNEMTITIHGDRYSTVELPFIGSKFIAVAEKHLPMARMTSGEVTYSKSVGQLEIHGRPRLRTWTKVNATSYAGSNYVLTSEQVDFAPGDRVILTGSEMPGVLANATNGFGYEELVVLSNEGGFNVTFTTALQFTHRAEVVVVEGRTIDLRCEVGLLSRNVIIQGDEELSDGQLFGVHTIAMVSGIYRMENAEIRRCGQAFGFGRYCTHSHMARDMEGSYVKANSIHHSYQRAVTTHDTNNWEVRDNVAFNVQGHAYFVEDGSELLNSITGNLGVFIRRSSALLKSDQKPAIFWTASPQNFWRDNVAAHSAMFGFWFELPSTEEDVCPLHMDLGEFRNNTLHSNGAIGLRIYPHWLPLVNPCDESSASKPQYLHTLLSYRNGGNGLFSKKHGDLHHISPTFVENGDADVSIVHYKDVNYTMDANVVDGLFVGSLSSSFDVAHNLGKTALFLPQEEFFYVRNSTFVNYGTSGIISSCNSCLEGSEMTQGGSTFRFSEMRFVNSPKKISWKPTKKDIYWDLDGSVTGFADSMITKDYGHLHLPECEVLSVEEYDGSVRCGGTNSTVRLRRMSVESVTPSQLSYTDVLIRSSGGMGRVYFLPIGPYGWVFPVLTGGNHSFQLLWNDAGISAYSLNYTLSAEEYLLESLSLQGRYDETVVMSHQLHTWDLEPYSFKVQYADRSVLAPLNNTRPLLRMAQSQFQNNTIDVALSTTGAHLTTSRKFNVFVQSQLCPPKGCPLPPQPSLSTPMKWSKASSWSSGKVPIAGQKVTIESNRWIVLDTNTPKLGCVVVYGKLSFLSNQTHPLSLNLTAQCIQVFGTLEISGHVYNKSNNATVYEPFAGTANVVLWGTKSQSLPVTMSEGKYVGSKVIAVAGKFAAVGQSKSYSHVKLASTVHAGDVSVFLSSEVNWAVGDSVVLSPTGYFTATGAEWSGNYAKKGSADETRVVKQIGTVFNSVLNSNCTVLTVSRPFNHTHLCEVVNGQSFCGTVGVLSRNVRFLSLDGSDIKTTSYGFGAHLHVIDTVTASTVSNANNFFGSLHLDNVEFSGFGKVDSDKYMITFDYYNHAHPASLVTNCSFHDGFNTAIRSKSLFNATLTNNVAVNVMGGGLYIDALSDRCVVTGNVMIGARQLSSVLKSTYPWTRPIAGFSIFSASTVVRGNLAAGSQDQGFALAAGLFRVSSAWKSACGLTYSQAYSYGVLASYRNAFVEDNEAVACRTGFALVTMSTSESSFTDCAVVKGVFSWRNSYSGILFLDATLNVVVTEALLAENFIGLNLLFYSSAERGMAALVNSTVMSSLSAEQSTCGDLSDSKYLRGKHCATFTESDPLGLLSTCGSVFGELYRRVGVAIPQWTNKGRTCALAERFTTCDPPNTPDRLCLLPYDKRYALPVDMIYAEMHIHDTAFHGFLSANESLSSNRAGECIPSLDIDRSVAIAKNPSQYDYEPVLITSGLVFPQSDYGARIGMDVAATDVECHFTPCSGRNQVLINDLDGSLSNYNSSAQLVFDTATYVASQAPFDCIDMYALTPNMYLCPQQAPAAADRLTQYSAVWRDWGPQIIHPIRTTRRFDSNNLLTSNRTFASYGPKDDMCAKRFYFSRFNTLISNGGLNHRIAATGTIPDEFLFRWDAPYESDVAVIEFFVQHTLNINVYVSDSPYSNFVNVPKIARYPNASDAAGTNLRDPQNRFLAVTIRGGSFRYYKFVKVPVVPVTIRMDMTLSQFYGDKFIANLATLLSIAASRIKITQVRVGSVIADVEISPAVTVANSTSAVASQIDNLRAVTANITTAISTGAISVALNVTVFEVFAQVPVMAAVLDETSNAADNSTSFNITAYRAGLVAASAPVVEVLFTYPTSMPTGQPSSQPSARPSAQPVLFPTAKPTGQPSSSPTRTFRPSSSPTKKPTPLPSVTPSLSPTHVPSLAPSHSPTVEPTSAAPSISPTHAPTVLPTLAPTLAPTASPTSSYLQELSMTVTQQFQGLTANSLRNQTIKAMLCNTIVSYAIDDTAGTPNITITNLVDVTARKMRSRQLLAVSDIEVLSLGNTVSVTYVIVYTLDASVTLNTTALRSSFITQFTAALDTGTFASALQALDSLLFQSFTGQSSSLTVSAVTVTLVARPNMPTYAPTSSPKSSHSNMHQNGIIAAIVIFSSLGGLMLVYSALFCFRGKMKRTNSVAVIVTGEGYPVHDTILVQKTNAHTALL